MMSAFSSDASSLSSTILDRSPLMLIWMTERFFRLLVGGFVLLYSSVGRSGLGGWSRLLFASG